jgi:hypothetical protein
MGTNFILWAVAFGACAALAAQWIVLRSRYLKGIAQQRARHQQQQHTTQQQLEQAKQQIARLQHDLSATRLLVQRQIAREPARAQQRARAEEPAAHHALPRDGFADTLPSPQYPHDVSLLKH